MGHGVGQVSGAPSPDSPNAEFQPSGLQSPEFGDGSLSSSSRFSSRGLSEVQRDCDPGSARSLGAKDGDFRLDDYILDGRFPRKIEDEKGHQLLNPAETGDDLSEYAGSSWAGLEPSMVERLCGDSENLAVADATVTREQTSINSKARGNKISNELVVYGGHSDGQHKLSTFMGIEERDQEIASSTDEHSDGEDSLNSFGLDTESRHDVYYTRNEHYHSGKETKKGNMILMDSLSAFGSADWEQFELEKVENSFDLQMFNQHPGNEAPNFGTCTIPPAAAPAKPFGHEAVHGQTENRYTSDVIQISDNVQGISEPISHTNCTSVECIEPTKVRKVQPREAKKDLPFSSEEYHANDGSMKYLEGLQLYNNYEKTDPLLQRHTSVLGSRDSVQDKKLQNDAWLVYHKSESLPDIMPGHASRTNDVFEDPPSKDIFEDEKLGVPLDQLDSKKAKDVPHKAKIDELNAFDDELVLDMEEILLDSCMSPLARLNQSNKIIHSRQSSSLRDGSSTASTSGTDDTDPLNYPFLKIDGVEVVGVKQKRGDISLSERLVGVKEHTVYIIRIWGAENRWEVERRYRDFYILYTQLKAFFFEQAWILPSPWSAVAWDSKKVFGNSSPDVIVERSTLIQECLLSVIKSTYPSGFPSALIWFLSPPKPLSSSPLSNVSVNQSDKGSDPENISTLGNKVSLIVDLRPHKSMKQMLEAQHYTCEGCHKQFDGGGTRVLKFVRAFGWGKPKLCEYTGLLFCSSCHTNETAVLPARVLHYWDFTEYPISQLAKSYLDSIIDQPMLCVSAVNPFLFSRVNVLFHVVGIRRKIGALLHYVRCPFRGSIYRRIGSRRHLLESNDFFALRDLIDLSRGAFAALPVILEIVLNKIQEHITEHCLVCCEVGLPCGARQACDDTSSLIFPFQDEEENRRCGTCNLVFHKHCFERLVKCPCGARLKLDEAAQVTRGLSLGASHGGEDGGGISLLRGQSDLSLRSSMGTGFLSSLFPTGRQEKTMEQEGNNVILMSSLPGLSEN